MNAKQRAIRAANLQVIQRGSKALNKPTQKPFKKSAAPKKLAQRQRRQEQVKQDLKRNGGKIFETKQQQQADPRFGKNGFTDTLASNNQINTIVQSIYLEQSLLEDWARGFVMKACEKGYQVFEQPEYPYYAYVYIVQTLKALMTNTVPPSTKVPYILLCIARGLQPKNVPCANGRVSYSSLLPEGESTPDPSKVIGFTLYGNQWSLGVPGAPLVNVEWPTISTTGLEAAYTTDLGATAFNRICEILVQGNEELKKSAMRMVQVSDNTPLDRDVSMYAYSLRNADTIGLVSAGTGGNRSGGTVAPVNLEVPIHRPQFAAFTTSNTPDPPEGLEYTVDNRFGNFHANTTGDGTFLAAAMLTWFTENKWNLQRPPKLHYVDFMEFGSVLAKWVSGIQQAYVNDAANAANLAADPTIIQCPLTLQEVLLGLRNVMMTAFKDTQAGVHGIYPVVPFNDTDPQFVPFIVATNTCFLAPNPMNLPSPLIENIRALTYREVHRGGSDWEAFIPVLGQRQGVVLDETDYVYRAPGIEIPFPSFKPQADVFKKKIVTKLGEVFQPLAETPISMIDGNSSGGYVCINNPKKLKDLSDLFNSWLVTTGVSAYSVSTGLLGTEKGINVLVSCAGTRIQPVEAVLRKQAKSRSDAHKVNGVESLDSRVGNPLYERIRLPISTPFTGKGYLGDFFQSKILATAYEQVLSVWILPTFQGNLTTPNKIGPVKWQSIMGESYVSVSTDSYDTPSLDDLHSNYAIKMVRNKLDQKNDWEQLFDEMAAQGRGGLLTGIIGKFANMIVPGAGQVIEDVGNTFGI